MIWIKDYRTRAGLAYVIATNPLFMHQQLTLSGSV